MAELRSRAYAEAGVDTASGWLDLPRRTVTFVRRSAPVPGRLPEMGVPTPGASVAPDPAGFARIQRALELYCQDFRSLIQPESSPGWDWHDLGLDLLQNASYWLLHYYYLPEARTGQEEAIGWLQASARDAAGLIERHPAFKNSFGRPDRVTRRVNWGVELLTSTSRPQETIHSVKALWGQYWVTSPEQGLQSYRDLLSTGLMPRLRPLFLERDFLERSPIADPARPTSLLTGGTLHPAARLSYLAGWTPADRQRVLSAWHGFIEEVCASTNDSLRLEGLMLRCAHATTDPDHDRAGRELVGFLETHPHVIGVGPDQETLLRDVDTIFQPRWRTGFQASALGARTELWTRFKQRSAGLGGSTKSELQGVVNLPSPAPPTPIAAGSAPAPSAARPVPRRGDLFTPIRRSGSGEGTDPASLVLSNVLDVARFFALPETLPGSTNRVALSVVSCCYREERLWVEARYDHLGGTDSQDSYVNRGVIFTVDPGTFQSEAILLDPAAFQLSPHLAAPTTDRMIEVFNGWLYIGSGALLKRYSPKERRWEDLAVPLQGQSRICRVGSRLFVCTPDSILEIGAEGRQARLLASNRRRPAVTALDAVEPLNCPPLLSGAQGSLVALVGGRLYRQLAGESDWRASEGPELENPHCSLFDSGLLVSDSPQSGETRLYGWFEGSSALELLLAHPATSNPLIRLPRPPGPIVGPPPARGLRFGPGLVGGDGGSANPPPGHSAPARWPLPENIRALNYPVCLDGKCLWIFAGTLTVARESYRPIGLVEQNGRHAVLFCLRPDAPEPLAIPLRFQVPPGVLGRGAPGLRGLLGAARSQVFEPTPAGLVLASPTLSGFWLIPRQDLTERSARWLSESTRNPPGSRRQKRFPARLGYRPRALTSTMKPRLPANASAACVLAGLLLPQLLPAQLEVIPATQPQRTFSGPGRNLAITWHNNSQERIKANISLRLVQLTSALSAEWSFEPWKTMELLPGQLVLETTVIDFPFVRAETPFLLQWLDPSRKVLGSTHVLLYPTNLLGELRSLGGALPIGVMDPAGQLKPLLVQNGVEFLDLDQTGDTRFEGRLALLGPFPSGVQAPAGLGFRIKALARKGAGVVWLQPPPDPREPIQPSFYTVPGGRGTVVVVQAGLITDLAANPESQLNLLRLARLALNPQPFTLPLLAREPGLP